MLLLGRSIESASVQRAFRSVVSDSLLHHGLKPSSLLCPWGFSRQEYWSGLLCIPPGDLPNPGIESALLYCRWILYRLSHQGSPFNIQYIAKNIVSFGQRGSPWNWECLCFRSSLLIWMLSSAIYASNFVFFIQIFLGFPKLYKLHVC